MREPLHRFADIYYGKSPAEVLSDDSDIPLFGTGGRYGSVSRSLFNGPAVVVARKGSLGSPHFTTSAFWASDTTYAVIPKHGVDARWLYYSLSLFDLTKLNEATGVPSISRDWLRRIELESEKPPQQRRIAEILGTVDEAIEQTEALIAKQQQVKAGLMHDFFTRGLTADGQLRPAGTERKTKFGWLPKDWRIGSLADATKPARQPILTGPFGADLGNDDFVEEGVPVLRIGNVQTGRIDVSDLLFVAPKKAAFLERYRVRSGDLLFARQGATTGRNALASDEVNGWLINYHIIRVALDHSLCVPVFIEAAFNGEMVLRQVDRDKGRGTREGINSEQLRSLELPLPDFDEQVRIADRLVAQQREISTGTAQLAKLRQLKQGLMQDLLTGRVLVPA